MTRYWEDTEKIWRYEMWCRSSPGRRYGISKIWYIFTSGLIGTLLYPLPTIWSPPVREVNNSIGNGIGPERSSLLKTRRLSRLIENRAIGLVWKRINEKSRIDSRWEIVGWDSMYEKDEKKRKNTWLRGYGYGTAVNRKEGMDRGTETNHRSWSNKKDNIMSRNIGYSNMSWKRLQYLFIVIEYKGSQKMGNRKVVGNRMRIVVREIRYRSQWE